MPVTPSSPSVAHTEHSATSPDATSPDATPSDSRRERAPTERLTDMLSEATTVLTELFESLKRERERRQEIAKQFQDLTHRYRVQSQECTQLERDKRLLLAALDDAIFTLRAVVAEPQGADGLAEAEHPALTGYDLFYVKKSADEETADEKHTG